MWLLCLVRKEGMWLINLPDGGLDLVSLICRDRPTFGPSGWNSAPHYSRHFLHCVSLPSFPIDSRPLTPFVLSLLPRRLSSCLSSSLFYTFFHPSRPVLSSFFLSFLALSVIPFLFITLPRPSSPTPEIPFPSPLPILFPSPLPILFPSPLPIIFVPSSLLSSPFPHPPPGYIFLFLPLLYISPFLFLQSFLSPSLG